MLLSIKKSELDSKNMRVKTVVLKANNTTLVNPSVKTLLFLTFSPIVDTTYNRLSESRVLIHFSDFKPLYDK